MKRITVFFRNGTSDSKRSIKITHHLCDKADNDRKKFVRRQGGLGILRF
jgi:hypothetical protein